MDPYAEQQQPPRPHRGFLWGCGVTLIAAVVITVAVFSYGAWHFFGILDNNAHIQLIVDAMNRSDEATAVLGTKIKVMESEQQTFSYATGKASTATYVLKVVGSNGAGEVKADLDTSAGKTKIKTLVLTDAAGRIHYIVGEAPPNPMMQNSI